MIHFLQRAFAYTHRHPVLRLAWWFAYFTFHWSLAFAAIAAIAAAFYPSASADSTQVQIHDLDRRVTDIEGWNVQANFAAIHQELVDLHKDLDKKDSDWKPLGTLVAAMALVLERAARAMVKGVKEADEEP